MSDRPADVGQSCGPAPDAGPDARLDAQELRFGSAVERYIPYLGLAIGSLLTLVTMPSAPLFWPLLAGLSALWSYIFVTRTPSRATDPGWGMVYLVVLLVLMGLLVVQSGWFGFQAFAGYAHSVAFLRGRLRWVGVAATGSLAAYGQIGSPSGGELTPGLLGIWVGLAALNAAMGGLFTFYGALTDQQSQRRRQMITELNEANRRLSESLEENAGLHVRLLAQAREAGVLDERARLAREIHDTIAQGLAGIITQLEAAGAADGASEARLRHVDTARALARESLTEARRSVEALAPVQLDSAQLPDAIAEMAKRWAETAEVDLMVETTGDPRPLLPDCEVALFRVAQEALANVGKHAGATRVGLTLSYMDDQVVLDVWDDGRGFRLDERRPPGEGSGFGLAAMEQRVRRVSGSLTVESTPDDGTAVSASVPAIPAEVRS